MTEPEKTEIAVTPEPEAPVVEPVEDTSAEDASDAELRAWARDNGIEDVPASGRLSASWRDQITNAMARALAADPKAEVSAESSSPPSTSSSTSTPTKTTPTPEAGSTDSSTDQSKPDSTEESNPEPEPELVEYRSVWEAPDTWVSGQTYTA